MLSSQRKSLASKSSQTPPEPLERMRQREILDLSPAHNKVIYWDGSKRVWKLTSLTPLPASSPLLPSDPLLYPFSLGFSLLMSSGVPVPLFLFLISISDSVSLYFPLCPVLPRFCHHLSCISIFSGSLSLLASLCLGQSVCLWPGLFFCLSVFPEAL